MLYITMNIQYRKSDEILAVHWADEMKAANTHPDIVKTAIYHFMAKWWKETHSFYLHSLMA